MKTAKTPERNLDAIDAAISRAKAREVQQAEVLSKAADKVNPLGNLSRGFFRYVARKLKQSEASAVAENDRRKLKALNTRRRALCKRRRMLLTKADRAAKSIEQVDELIDKLRKQIKRHGVL